MGNTYRLVRPIVPIGLVLFLFLCLVLLSKSTAFSTNSSLFSLAITLDLIFAIPTLYFLLIRRTKVHRITVLLVLVIGLIVGTSILPAEKQYFLSLFKVWGLPFIELVALAFVIAKIRSVVKIRKKEKQSQSDFFTSVKAICTQFLPQKVIHLIAFEIAVLYYGFFSWKKIELGENEFSYHKNNTTLSLFGIFIFLTAIETFVLHLLVIKWSFWIAWILSGASFYLVVQLFGLMKSFARRPHTIGKDRLLLRYGIATETEIKFEDIKEVILSNKDLENNNLTKKLSILGDLEGHNVIIRLNKENILTSLYGLQKRFNVLALYVDNAESFKQKIDAAIKGVKVIAAPLEQWKEI
ncbi:MAG: hypothetical protein LDLANPLL_02316 [Turneriella sp.]|nr:hypothetical protein [Turneriella sp.]